MAGRGRPRHIRVFLEGYDKAWKKAKTLEEAIPLLMTSALHSEAKRMMRRSQQLVPRDTGALAASGYVEKPIVYPHYSEVELGYNSDYAVRVHEMPRSGVTGGVFALDHDFNNIDLGRQRDNGSIWKRLQMN